MIVSVCLDMTDYIFVIAVVYTYLLLESRLCTAMLSAFSVSAVCAASAKISV